jgi:ubiquinone/menaquinone biosynthesis C-methylase UbiE
MGEIFVRELPAKPLRFTGERMTSDAEGQIEYEHIHRYLFARQLVRDRDVLDLASGEGYGSALLAQTACRVIGVDIAEDAVRHAALSYRKPNLSFIRGDARDLPIESASVDFVTSFETIEHLVEQEKFIMELRRVLRPEGVAIISSPDRDIYSPNGRDVNPFHCKELTQNEFIALINQCFSYTHLYMQRPFTGCAIIEDVGAQCGSTRMTFERRGDHHFEASSGLARAPYLIVIASDQPCSLGFDSLYVHTSDVDHGLREARIASAAREEATQHAKLAEQLKSKLSHQADELDTLREQNRRLYAELAIQTEEISKFRAERRASIAGRPKVERRRVPRADDSGKVAGEAAMIPPHRAMDRSTVVDPV